MAPPEAVAGVEIQETALRGTGYAYFYEMGPGTGTDASIRDFHEEAACLVTLFPLCFFSAGKSLAGVASGLFQTVELLDSNAKPVLLQMIFGTGPAVFGFTLVIPLAALEPGPPAGAGPGTGSRSRRRSSGSSQGSRAMAPFSQSTR